MSISSRIPNRAVTAISSVVLAAGVAVIINVWTSGWAWPAGVSLGVLLILQCIVEWLRDRGDKSSAEPERKQSLTQITGNLSESHIVGISGGAANTNVNVQQAFGDVERSTIVGIELNLPTSAQHKLPQGKDVAKPPGTGA